jgi:spore germination protein PA/spore germination protein PF
MPSIVGNFKVISVGSGAIVQVGDAIYLSPKSASKTYAGAGSFNTGDLPVTNNAASATNTFDSDLVDDSTATGT